MKHFRLLFLLLAAVCSPSVFAQNEIEVDESSPLITDVEQLSSPWNAPHDYEGNLAHLLDGDPVTYWHTTWNDNSHRHYLQVALDEPVYDLTAFRCTRRMYKYNSSDLCVNDHVTQWGIFGSDDPDAEESEWVELAQIVTPYNEPGEIVTGAFDPQGKQYLRFYGENTNTGNRWWHAAEFQLYPVLQIDELAIAKRELGDLFNQYTNDRYLYEELAGTEPGMYDAQAVAAFIDAWEAAGSVDAPGASFTLEEIRAMIENLTATYQAVRNAMIPMTLTDGYYRIRHSCAFINNVPTGETDEENRPITEPRDVAKYMYGTLEGEKISVRWNTPTANGQACPYLWKVTNRDGYFDIMNCATDSRFNEVPKDSYVTMSSEATNLMAVDVVHNVNGDPHVTLRVSTQLGTDHTFLHPLSHGIQAADNIGRGTEGYVIGWANDAYGVSEWVFEPVSQEEAEAAIAAYEPYKNRAVMVENFKTMLNDIDEKMPIAKDLSVSYDAEKPYITEVDQLSSPWNAPHEWEGNLEHLIDNDPLTYWHTNWNNNSNWQYLQVELKEPAYQLTAMHVIRRKYKYNSTTDLSTADHVTVWGVLGSDEPDTEDADWVELATLVTPYQGPGEELTAAFDPQGKQYLRFYAKETISGKRYWHCAEFQLYPGEIVDPEHSQYHMMGQVAATMDALYTELKDIDPETITTEQYTAFKEAYDAFIAQFVNPADLREQIESSKGADNMVEVGTNPGFWPDRAVCDNLAKAIADAQAYDEAGIYTKEASETHKAALKAAVDAIPASALRVQPGKWYRIRFGTEEEYDAHNWNKVGNETDIITVDDEEIIRNEANWGHYMTVARLEQYVAKDDEGNTLYTQNFVNGVDADEVHVGDKLYGDALEDIMDNDADMALFRFLPFGDGTYVIQNKATGLYVEKKVESGDILLGVHPALFKQEIAGYGQSYFTIKTLSDEAQNPLHFARSTNVITTYGRWGDSDGRRGCFFIEEVADVAADYAANPARIGLWEGSMTSHCYPVTMKAIDGDEGAMWTVSAIERAAATDDAPAQLNVTLVPMADNVAPAGTPFIYIHDDYYVPASERDEDTEQEMVAFTFGSDFVTEPQNSGALKGVFTQTTLQQGVLTIQEDGLTRTTDNNTRINTNRAYIAEETAFPRNYEIKLILDETGETGIAAALQQVAQTGDIYTLDGRLVGRGNLNSLRGAQPGIYVVGGVKVAVKR